MKDIIVLILLIVCNVLLIVGIATILTLSHTNNQQQIVIDLPEEINEADSTSKLKCHMRNDTLFVEFDNKYL